MALAHPVTGMPTPEPGSLLILAAGTLALTAARFRFPNWPFHPIGFALAPVWIMDAIWFSVFLTWLVKSTILRYGGMRGYALMRPFFLGLICGQFSLNCLWLILDKLTGHTGVSLFWI